MLLTMEVVIVVMSLSAVSLYLFVLVRLLFIIPDFHKGIYSLQFAFCGIQKGKVTCLIIQVVISSLFPEIT